MEKHKNKAVAVVGSRGVKSCAALARRLAELEPAEVVSGGGLPAWTPWRPAGPEPTECR